jgi:hypothetical protein
VSLKIQFYGSLIQEIRVPRIISVYRKTRHVRSSSFRLWYWIPLAFVCANNPIVINTQKKYNTSVKMDGVHELVKQDLYIKMLVFLDIAPCSLVDRFLRNVGTYTLPTSQKPVILPFMAVWTGFIWTGRESCLWHRPVSEIMQWWNQTSVLYLRRHGAWRRRYWFMSKVNRKIWVLYLPFPDLGNNKS